MYNKVRFYNVILKLIVLSVFLGCFFIFGINRVLAFDAAADASKSLQNPSITVNPVSSDSDNTQSTQLPAVSYPTSAYITAESAHSLGIVLPDKLDVGNKEYNLESVTGYRIYVYKDSTELFNSGDTYRDAGTGLADLESLVRSIAIRLTNDSENLRFKVTYIGKNELGEYTDAKDADGKIIEWMSDILSVYKVSINGDHINSAYTYGFSGQNVVLVPSIAGDYSFQQWSDGNMQNPRIEQISTNVSENVYNALVAAPEIVMHEDGEGYDVIPKTGEGNSTFWLIFMSVFGVLGTGYVLFSMVLIPMNKKSGF